MRRLILAGLAVAIVLVGGLGSWAALAEISGAVIAAGRVAVVSEVKKVQHPTGGVVDQLLVREGEVVREGQPLIRLDDTVTRANLGVITAMLDELLARQSRLRSERDGREEIAFAPELVARKDEAAVGQIIASEERLFMLRRTARTGNKAGLSERIAQLRQEILGLEEQVVSKRKELEFVAAELDATRELWEKKLVQRSRLVAVEREAVRIAGLSSELTSQIAQTRGRIAEIELQILQIERDFNSEVARELREVDGKISELNERRIAAEDQLKRVEIVAPVAGSVYQLAVHTLGGVIGPGEVLMSIVPANEELNVKAAIRPTDIDQLHVGAPARIRLSAYSQRTTPELNARLAWISPDVSVDEKTGETYYEVRVTIEKGEAARLEGIRIIPGMPVEVFLKTSDRNVASLLLKPLTDQLYRSFRED
jgi:HlyD family secretion protein